MKASLAGWCGGAQMDACGATVFDVRQEVWEAYRQEMHRRLPTTVWWTGEHHPHHPRLLGCG